jgi:tetratricopeptide (TPR) repeat protein
VDTLELLPSLAQGELGQTSAAELVAAVFRARASGTLSIESKDTGEIRAFFRAGDVCGTASFAGFRTLAHVLLDHDFIGALDIVATRDESAQGQKRHGEVLVQKGLLTPEQLRDALAIQCRENLGILLRLSAGTYEWRGWEPPPPWTREMSIETASAIFEALAEPHLAARRSRIVDWLGEERARLSSDWNDMRQRLALQPAEMKAVQSLASPRSAAEFVNRSGLAKERAEALLAALLLTGGAEPGDAGAAAAESTTDVLELDTAAIDPLPQLEADDLETPFEKTLTPPKLVTPVPKAAAPAPVAADEDEPLELLEPEEQVAEPDDRAKDLRRKLLQRGMRNLGFSPEREEAVGKSEELELQSESREEQLPPELRAFADEVREKAAQIEAQDAYVRLGVSRNASSDAIKQAYLTAAKRYHPDRTASHAGLQPIRRELQHVFAALREAHEMISTPEARAEYDSGLRSGGGGASRKDQSAMALKMGDVLLKKRDYEAAIAKLRRAVDFDANGESLAALAWALMADPKQTAAGKEEAMTLVNRAVRAAGATARTWYVAGALWRTKDPSGAAEAFRKALELDPRHTDAALELRLLETRQNKSAAKSKRKP